MYIYELFSHSDRFIYRTQLISNATCVLILCTALTFLPPFLLTYYTGDFWIKESIYSEQPRLDSSAKFILIADNNAANNQFFMSSYSTLNRNFQDSLIQGSTVVLSSDVDGDGLIDQYRASFDLTFAQASTVIRNINIWLIFQFELHGKQQISMETMALVSYVPPTQLTPTNNQNLTIYGQLVFEQRKAIQNSGSETTYNTSIINVDNLVSAPDISSILANYYTRNYYTTYETQYTWMTPRTTSSTNMLTVNVVVNVGRQAIRYMPGFWQAFKWGWIQYICVLLPFMAVFNRLKLFVFSNHLVRTLVPLPKHRHKA